MLNKNKFISGIFIILATLALVAAVLPNILKNTKLGLDLKGGIEIVYRVEPFENEVLTESLMDSVVESLNKRVNSYGISETVINQEGGDLIRIQIPGISDQQAAREYIGSTALLTFRDSSDNLLMTADVLEPGGAKYDVDQSGRPAVSLKIKDSSLFGSVTERLSSSRDAWMAIWLDYDEETNSFSDCSLDDTNCISSAVVNQRITTNAIITGNFTTKEAKSLANLINSGSLQAKLVEEYSSTIGASFGEKALNLSVKAGTIGLILIMLFMIFKYRFSGVISSVSIVAYALFVFLIFYVLGGTLTLPGIAALLLGIGMAVDSNVITFERIKDEYRQIGDVLESFKKGNKKSFITIFDANITTLIIAIILYIFGETAIKGFATVLIINIFATFIITVLFTRFILNLFVTSNYFAKKVPAFIGYRERSLFDDKLRKGNYVNSNRIFFTISTLIVLGGVVFGQVKGYNLGIDFTSGTSVNSNISLEESKEFENYLDEKYNIIDSNYIENKNLSIVRMNNTLTDVEVNELTNYVETNYGSEVNIQKVSPFIGDKIIKNSILSLLIAGVAIAIYISIRFRGSFALASIVALVHDLLCMFAIFAFFSFTISGDFVAALLAILGYSINDTIVLFDRIRDNINDTVKSLIPTKKKKGKKTYKNEGGVIEFAELKEIVNKSVQGTVGRSLITSFTTLIPVVALIFLGAIEIIEFNIALAIGIVFGTYSSIFIGAQIWLFLNKKGYRYGKNKDGWFAVDDIDDDY